jgi:hypothetical protein
MTLVVTSCLTALRRGGHASCGASRGSAAVVSSADCQRCLIVMTPKLSL